MCQCESCACMDDKCGTTLKEKQIVVIVLSWVYTLFTLIYAAVQIDAASNRLQTRSERDATIAYLIILIFTCLQIVGAIFLTVGFCCNKKLLYLLGIIFTSLLMWLPILQIFLIIWACRYYSVKM
ncbi:uncharacterized protein Dvir_GJ26667, isoform A [Drosophila virilis]|uniref:Uncharacterized protein, isoform A n=1 Tax=Drosophila virilis TaxID=7244 RepID=A0A0Q9WIV7_DROVI|nr:uncharacterized protein LOC26531437 [Drosophila virilis]KRF83894.1 uncharacterized protein Dvir_GJ26667, isoform A [Drosophila virilis]